MCKIQIQNLGSLVCLFFVLVLLEIKNGDENVFGWIFENIFIKNIFSNEPKTENNKISFLVL